MSPTVPPGRPPPQLDNRSGPGRGFTVTAEAGGGGHAGAPRSGPEHGLLLAAGLAMPGTDFAEMLTADGCPVGPPPAPARGARRSSGDWIAQEPEASRVAAQANWTPAVRAMFAQARDAERDRLGWLTDDERADLRRAYPAPPAAATAPRRMITRYTDTPFIPAGDY